MGKKKKIRVEMRKNRAKPPRENDLTRAFEDGGNKAEDAQSTERVRAKGDISRHRTVVREEAAAPGDKPAAGGGLAVELLLRGRVLRVHGLASVVEAEDGRVFRCAVRRILKTMATDERNAVTTGDIVWFRHAVQPSSNKIAPASIDDRDAGGITTTASNQQYEGMIERVEPRHGVLTRSSRRREHILVANVDQLAIIISLVEPDLKPHLIDRYLAAAQQGGLSPILCLNKIDLADPALLQSLVGGYCQLGIPTFLTSAKSGQGIDRLREQLRGRATVFSGQSGVGKSSLLNAVEPGLGLSVKTVSDVNQKGRHTTTYSQLIKLASGGWVVDTPGVRQLALWATRPEEIEGYFAEFRPFIPLCNFPDCTHTHEIGCQVKAAVARQMISSRRYHSYLGMFNGSEE